MWFLNKHNITEIEEFEPMNPADVKCPCCRPQLDNTTPDTPDCRPQPDTINTGRSTDRAADNLPLESVPDTINPSHYKQGNIECIDAIKAATGDGFRGYLTGNILKYMWRWKHKNGVEDLKKARWYLDRLIGELDDAGR